MAVHLTRIYTRTGDDGTTGLSDMSRVAKTDARLVAYADCDEANAAIGAALALGHPDTQITDVLRQIQNDLFDAGADLSTPIVENPKHPPLRIAQSYIDRLEGWCDAYNAGLACTKILCTTWWFTAVGAVARRSHRRSPGRAIRVGRGRRSPGRRQRTAGEIPEPAVGSAVHPVAGSQSRR